MHFPPRLRKPWAVISTHASVAGLFKSFGRCGGVQLQILRDETPHISTFEDGNVWFRLVSIPSRVQQNLAVIDRERSRSTTAFHADPETLSRTWLTRVRKRVAKYLILTILKLNNCGVTNLCFEHISICSCLHKTKSLLTNTRVNVSQYIEGTRNVKSRLRPLSVSFESTLTSPWKALSWGSCRLI